tara:strand:- start:1540 stop:3099 length:1560 start_codon:yes stop_codon:yes gene_type:complete
MFDLIFENRQKKVNHLLKAADSLGRSLRENVSLLSIDDAANEVLYLTETNKVIKATYSLQDDLLLSNISVEDADVFTDDEKFDNIVGLKVTEFVERIYEDKRTDADSSFNNILSIWENRLKFDHVKQKLQEESEKFNGSNRIIESTEFANFIEIIPQVVDFLKEHKEELLGIPEIKNGAVLSETVARAFNFEKISYEDLVSLDSYKPHTELSNSVYEMICKQELVKKELLESKNNFNTVWGVSDEMNSLAGLVFESSKKKVAVALVEAITSIPYVALASKKQLFESIKNSLYVSEMDAVKDEDIKNFVSTVFEMKKPIKGLFSNLLTEKYGVNINNLKDVPSFRSLLNTQVVIFETISKLSPKGSVQRRVLNEVAQGLKTKNGVESIDVNDYLQILFETAGYSFEEYTLIESINFATIPQEIGNISELVQTIMEQMGEDDEEKELKQDPKEKEEDAPDESEDVDSEDVGEEEAEDGEDVEDEEEEPKKMTLSKEEVMKGIKDLEDLMSGLDLGKDEENN